MKTSHIFSWAVLSKLPNWARDFFCKLERNAILVALYSGCCAGLTAHVVGYSFLWGFFPMSLLVFFVFETMALAADNPASKSWILRGVFALVIVLINTLGVETFVFQNSIENSFVEQVSIQKVEIDSIFLQKVKALMHQVDLLETENNNIQAQKREWSSRLFVELDQGREGRSGGPGPYFRNMQKMWKTDSANFERILRENANKLGSIQTAIDSLGRLELAKQNELINPEDRGVLERLEALHNLLFRPGFSLEKLFFVVFFLFSFFIEISTIIMKKNNPNAFELYHLEQQNQQVREQQKAGLNQKDEDEFEDARRELENKNKLLELKQQYEQEQAERKLEGEWKLKTIILKWLRLGKEAEQKLADSVLKLYRRKSVKTHLNGTSDNQYESSEE